MAGGPAPAAAVGARVRLALSDVAHPGGSDPEAVRAYFRGFGEKQAPANGSPLYAVLALGALADPEMMALAAHCAPSQPSANLLLAAVHDLLLAGADHPLRDYYRDVLEAGAEARAPDDRAYPLFRGFVLAHRSQVLDVLRSGLVQTNVVRRTTCMLPLFAEAFARGAGRPLALIEIGASAGLNLHWDRYQHRFERGGELLQRFGPDPAPLVLATEVRGEQAPPEIPASVHIGWRCGIDLHPLDVANPRHVRWLRALVFPEHVERHREIEAAAEVARERSVRLIAGDAVEVLPGLLAQVPEDTTICVYATMVLNQIPRAAGERLRVSLAQAGGSREISLLTLDGNAEGYATLRRTRFGGPEPGTEQVADAHAHGRWLRWGEATRASPAPGSLESASI